MVPPLSHQHLDHLVASDPRLQEIPRVVLAYGYHEIHHHLERWTLLSRQLRRSPYARFEHDLNGLQLIGRQRLSPYDGSAVVQLKTCKWNYRLRRH